MSNKKSFFKLLLAMFLGAVVGGTGSMLVFYFKDRMDELVMSIGEMMQSTGVVVEVILAITASAVVGGIYIYIKKLWKMEQASEDEAADVYGEKFERWAQIGICILDCMTGILVVFGCCAIPNNFSPYGKEGVMMLILVMAMILGGGFLAVMEILFYRLMQKRDPQKKGDPASLSFNKKWLEGCDETEKLVIYQSGYKAFGAVQIVLIVGILLALFGEAQFNFGKFPMILLGVAWIAGIAIFNISKLKGLTGKKRRM